MSTPCVYMHIVHFIMSIKHTLTTELRSKLLLMLDNKNSTQNHSSTVSSSGETTSADGPVLPVCSHSACDDGTKISALSTPEIEVHKGGAELSVQIWMTQAMSFVSRLNSKTHFSSTFWPSSHVRQPFFTLNKLFF